MSKQWTKSEVLLLKEKYSTIPTEKLSILLDKPKSAIYRKVAMLRLTKTRSRWSKADELVLKQQYSSENIPKLMKLLNRTRQSIGHKASRLSISNKNWNTTEIDLLQKNYKFIPMAELLLLFPNRSKTAIQTKVYSLGLTPSPSKKLKFYFYKAIEQAKKVHNNFYDYSQSKISASQDRIDIVCPKHGLFQQILNNHIRGSGCIKCSTEKLAKTTEQFIKEANKIHNNKYQYKYTIYKHSNKKIIITCPIHGNFEQTASKHLYYGCSQCSSSRGEKAIIQFLEHKNIDYKSQYRISDCKNKYPLPFDFAIFDNNNKLLGLVEYQGKQHYQKVNFFDKTKDSFKLRQKRDRIKVDYCKSHNIPLLIIPYTKFNDIENLLEDFI